MVVMSVSEEGQTWQGLCPALLAASGPGSSAPGVSMASPRPPHSHGHMVPADKLSHCAVYGGPARMGLPAHQAEKQALHTWRLFSEALSIFNDNMHH